MMYQKYFKRILDIILSSIAIIILFPVMLIVSFLIVINLGRPILFIQERIGKNEKKFKIYKFRSMLDIKDQDGNILSDDNRLTKFGKILRSTSLDELPEFFNILKGDMSIVGPRPLLIKYLPLYNERHRHRHDVKPGLTGYAQINGRNSINWSNKFELDIYYIKNISLFLDLSIIFKTIKVFLLREDITSNTSVTMEEFKGYE